MKEQKYMFMDDEEPKDGGDDTMTPAVPADETVKPEGTEEEAV